MRAFLANQNFLDVTDSHCNTTQHTTQSMKNDDKI